MSLLQIRITNHVKKHVLYSDVTKIPGNLNYVFLIITTINNLCKNIIRCDYCISILILLTVFCMGSKAKTDF